ncbi:MAG: class I SAM-dependent methyltransferase [Haloarculaceae archaeon]
MTDRDDPSRRLRSFYDRRARLYDAVATAPPVGRWRRRAVACLGLDPGDTVVEMGCGTGANLPYLREAVGPDGRVLGVDFARGALARADDRVRERGWQNGHLIQADATRPPVAGPVDGVLATFVAGTLAAPAEAVDGWCDLLDGGGSVALLNAQRTDRAPTTALNPLFDWLVETANPGPRAGGGDRLQRRVTTARETLADRTVDLRYESFAAGFLGVVAGRVA